MATYKVQRWRTLAGPTELRIHGVGGAPPESMLDDEAFLVAGNDTAGFYKADESIRAKQTVEAYSWGGLTSGGGFFQRLRKSFWVILLPYALVNAAGWMLTGKKADSNVAGDPEAEKGIGGDWRHRVVRLLGVWFTMAFGLWLAAVTIDLITLQCGGQAACADSHSWLKWLNGSGWSFLQDHPARLMVLGLVVPVVGLVVAWQIAYRSQRKAEDSFHPSAARSYEEASSAQRRLQLEDEWKQATGAAATRTALARGDLWGSPGRVGALTRIHLAAAVGAIAAVLAFTLGWLEHKTGDSRLVPLVLGIVALTILAWTVSRTLPGGIRSKSGTWWLLALAAAVLGVVAIVGWTVGPTWTELQTDLAFLEDPTFTAEAATAVEDVGVGRWTAAQSARDQFNGWFLAVGILPIVLLLVVFFGMIAYSQYRYDETHEPKDASGRASKKKKVHSKWGPWATSALGVVTGIPVLAGGAIWLGGFLDRFSERDEACLLCANEYQIAVPDVYEAAAVGFVIVLAVMIVAVFWYMIKLRLAGKPEQGIWRSLQTVFWLRHIGTGDEAKTPTEINEAIQEELWTDLVETGSLTKARGDFPQALGDKTDAEMRETWERHHGYPSWIVGLVGERLAVEFGVLEITRTILWGVGTAVGLGAWAAIDFNGYVRELTNWSLSVNFAKWALVAIFVAVVAVMYQSYRDAEKRRSVAKVWDILTFFPRWFHPFAPPSYAATALPQLRTHLRERHEGDPVVLAAHSQGTVIAVATVARLGLESRERVALLTFGSPVRSLYGWFFPRWFGRAEMDLVADSVGGRWRNLRRSTDPIGSTIFTPPGHESAVTMAQETPPNSVDGSRRVNDVDWIVPDPYPEWPAVGDPMPPTKGHSYYDADKPYRTALCELYELLSVPLDDVGCPAPDENGASIEEQPPT